MTLSVKICLVMNDFYCLYRRSGFYRKTLAEYLEVDLRTIKRWEQSSKPPVAVVKLLQYLGNDLGFINKDWSGFYFYQGELCSPEGNQVRPGQIRAHPYLQQTVDFRAAESVRLKAEIEQLKSFPVFNRKSAF